MNPQERREKSNVALLQNLSAAVSGHAAAATFACGGCVPFIDSAVTTSALAGEPKQSCQPITLRWDTEISSESSKISFPLPAEREQSQPMLTALESACKPATFGFDGKDILDENYRKAIKLDASEFSTNFHPHDCGIIEAIRQVLLPSTIMGGQLIGFGPHGLRAELYNLNVCSH